MTFWFYMPFSLKYILNYALCKGKATECIFALIDTGHRSQAFPPFKQAYSTELNWTDLYTFKSIWVLIEKMCFSRSLIIKVLIFKCEVRTSFLNSSFISSFFCAVFATLRSGDCNLWNIFISSFTFLQLISTQHKTWLSRAWQYIWKKSLKYHEFIMQSLQNVN